MNLNIDQFDPNVAELTKIAEEAKKVGESSTLKEIKEMRLSLGKARIVITKKGKEMREDALKFQKDVIAKERELIGIIEPEEVRLKSIEEQAALTVEMIRRKALIPIRRQMIGELAKPTDDELCAMDDVAFSAFHMAKVDEKNAEDKKIADEKKRLNDLKEAEERGRKEATEKAEREAKAKVEREAHEREDAIKAEKEKQEVSIRLAKQEAEKRERELAAAPDKEKLKIYAQSLVRVQPPDVKTVEAMKNLTAFYIVLNDELLKLTK